MTKIFLSVFVFLACFSAPSFAAEGPPEARSSKKPVKIKASTLFGYDNNAGLNAQRQEDFFAQETAGIYCANWVSKEIRFRASYELFNVNYFEATDENIFLQDAGAGLDFKLASSTLLETDYVFRYAYFPEDDLARSSRHTGRAGVRHLVSDRLTLRSGFAVSEKGYDDRKARESGGVLSDFDDRGDLRYTVDSEIFYKISKEASVIVGFLYYRNDSDDQFHDYYDYDVYRVFTKIFLKICPRVRATFRFAYDLRDFDSRPLVDDAAVFEKDDTYSASTALYYDFTRNLSMGAAYTYRERQSNEPSQSYSGSISTVGFYYSF